MRELLAITKALSDSNRLRILAMLQAGELCVCQIVEVLCLAPSTVSTHLSVLEHARLVESRKSGRWVYYRLPDAPVEPIIRDCLLWIFRSLVDDGVAVADREKVARVTSVSPEELCRATNGN